VEQVGGGAVFSVLEGSCAWWEVCSSGSKLWKNGEVVTYWWDWGSILRMGWYPEGDQ
jgi:hypothetical protein